MSVGQWKEVAVVHVYGQLVSRPGDKAEEAAPGLKWHRREGCARAASRLDNLLSPAGGHLVGFRNAQVCAALLSRRLATDRRQLLAGLQHLW